MAEWLRRWTRNPALGSPRAGSNPADYEELLSRFFAFISTCLEMILFDLNQLIPLNLQRKFEARNSALFSNILDHFEKL